MSTFEESSPEAPQPPIEVPPESLSAEILEAVLESFILREGTDYGAQEISLATKIEQLRRQLSRGEIKVVFDPRTESVTLMTKREWNRLQHPSR